MKIELAGEELTLLKEKALWWERRATLFVADLHFGKGDYLRRASLPVPIGNEAHDLKKLAELILGLSAGRLVILGDLFHSRNHSRAELEEAFRAFREAAGEVEIILVRGNHDIRSGDPCSSWRINCVNEFLEGSIVGVHEPRNGAGGLSVAGHIHPFMKLTGARNERLRLPVFWLNGSCLVLPAFGSFTGGAEIKPVRDDRIFAVTSEGIYELRPR